MDKRENFFISILSDHINKRKTNPVSDIDWGEISTWAHNHQVEGIVYYQCREFMPDNVMNLFQLHYLTTIVSYKKREQVLREIGDAFQHSDIQHLTIKGMNLANYYPFPPLRTMGDLDILIHKDDKGKAKIALETIGAKNVEDNPDYDWTFWYKNVFLELHHSLLYEEIVTVDKQARFFNNYWQYVKDGVLDSSFHFLYLLVHLRKHLMNKGAGFRMFMDIAVMAQKKPNMDWGWIENKLLELDLLKFARVCFALIERWFGVYVPLEIPKLDELFLEKATQKIIADGVFGFQNPNNQGNSAVNELASNGRVDLSARLRMIMRKLFPSYKSMENSPYYHFVRGKVWLLPIAWGYRILRLLTHQTESVDTIMGRVMTSKQVIDAREMELREWGLLD